MRLNTLKPLASNFMFTRSVNLKIFDKVISAAQLPGPTNELRPKLPTQAKQGAENVIPGEVVVNTPPPWFTFPQPLAQAS